MQKMSRKRFKSKRILFSVLLLFSFVFGLFPGASRGTEAGEGIKIEDDGVIFLEVLEANEEYIDWHLSYNQKNEELEMNEIALNLSEGISFDQVLDKSNNVTGQEVISNSRTIIKINATDKIEKLSFRTILTEQETTDFALEAIVIIGDIAYSSKEKQFLKSRVIVEDNNEESEVDSDTKDPDLADPELTDPELTDPELTNPELTDLEESSDFEDADMDSSEELVENYPNMLGVPKVEYTEFNSQKTKKTMSRVKTLSDSIAVTKTAVRTTNEQGDRIGCRTFEVTLGITGIPPIVPVDVVLVLDRSGSMAQGKVNEYVAITQNPDTSKSYYIKINGSYQSISYSSYASGWRYSPRNTWLYAEWDPMGDDDIGGDSYYNPRVRKPFYEIIGKDRMYYAKQAAADFAAKVLDPINGILGSRVSVVSFSGPTSFGDKGNQNQAITNQVLTSNLSLVNSAIDTLNASGGTNTQAGFIQGKSAITDTVSQQNPNSNKVVIMFTDGLPTASNGVTYEETTSSSHPHVLNAITAGQNLFGVADVFTIGLLQGMDNTERLLAIDVLNNTQNKGFFEAPTAQELGDIFNTISQDLGSSAKNALVKDKVGNNFDVVLPLPAGATYNSDPNSSEYRVITWDAGSIGTSKQLVYEVQAKPEYEGGEEAFTNEYANLTYTDVNNEPGTKEFNKPKVFVPTRISIALTGATILKGTNISLGEGEDPSGGNYMSQVTGGDNDGINFTYQWRKLGSNTVLYTEKNPTVAPEETTEYELTVIDSNGCRAIATMIITVVDKKTSIGIKKVAYKGTEQELLLNGAEFEFKKDGVEITTLPTSDGVISINDLVPGVYTLKETVAPTGYKLNETEYTIEMALDGTISITNPSSTSNLSIITELGKQVIVVNNEKLVNVIGKKIWKGGKTEEHVAVTLTLYRKSEGVETEVEGVTPVIDKVSGLNTEFTYTWSDLPEKDDAGNPYVYTLQELNVPPNYDAIYSGDQMTVTNTYKFTEIVIRKIVDGNFGDKTKQFTFTITLPEGMDFLENDDYNINSERPNEANFTLAHNDEITLTVPRGVDLTIKETNNNGYKVYVDDVLESDSEVTVLTKDQLIVIFKNYKEATIDTGVSMDSLPYILILSFIGTGGLGGLIWKRKRNYFS